MNLIAYNAAMTSAERDIQWTNKVTDESAKSLAEQLDRAREMKVDATLRGLVQDQELLEYILNRGTHMPLVWQLGFSSFGGRRPHLPWLSVSAAGYIQLHIKEENGIALAQASLASLSEDKAVTPDGRTLRLNLEQRKEYAHLIDTNDQTAFVIFRKEGLYHADLQIGNLLGSMYCKPPLNDRTAESLREFRSQKRIRVHDEIMRF